MLIRFLLWCAFLPACISIGFSQEKTTLQCYLKDEGGHAVQHGTITVRFMNPDFKADSIFFLRPDKDGRFEFDFPNNASEVVLEINSLGYESKKINIAGQTVSPLYIELQQRETILDEVKISAPSGIKVEKDTIRYDVEYFSDNNESKVEELISKLPGMHVDEHGNIRHNNRLISRVLLEGDDLFNERYKMLTKNLSASVIGEIEVISNHHPNPLLSRAGDGNESVLNLRLKNRNQIIHELNVQIGQGVPEGRHNYSVNYIGISQLIKGVVLGSSNNVGEDPVNFVSGESDHIIRTKNRRLENVATPSLFSFDSYRYSRISERRNNFNRAQMLSANFLFRLHPDLSLKSDISFVKDRKHQQLDNLVNILDIEDVSLYREQFQLQDRSRFLQHGIEATWNISDKSRLYYNSRLRWNSNRQWNIGELATRDFEQYANVKDRSIEQRLQLTQALGDKWVFDSEMLYYNQHNPSALNLTPAFIFEGLHRDGQSGYNRFGQVIEFPVEQFSVANRLLSKINKYRYEFSASYHSQMHDFTQTFEQYQFPDEQPISANQLLKNKRFQLDGEFKASFNSQLSLTAKVEGALQHVSIGRSDSSLVSNTPTFNSQLSLVYQVEKGTWALNYLFNRDIPPMLDFIQEYRVLNYRFAQRGLSRVLTNTNNMLNMSYGYADYSRSMLITNFMLGIGSNARTYLSKTDYTQYYQFTSFVEHDRLQMPYVVAIGKIEKYIRGLQGNAYLHVDHISTKAYSIRNDEFNTSVIHNTSLDFGIKTAWDKLLNFQLSIKPRVSYLNIASPVSGQLYNTRYLETSGSLFFQWDKQFNSQLIGSYYMLPDMNKHASLFLLDLKTRYIFKKDKFFLDFAATNIWNEKMLTFTQFNQWRQDTRTYRLIPNNYMVSVYYSF